MVPGAGRPVEIHCPTRFAAPSTVDDVVVVVRLFRFHQSLRITFRESIFFFTCTAFDVVPYEIITYVLNPPVFFGITYGAVCVPDLQYALRRQLRTVRDNSLSQKRPNSSNSITFDPDRNLRF